ncbi:MAG: 2-succinyl-6-hydroxy-2,4-cyclohexadiene-1-carboxylate synthase, partial [Ignavibacteriales bacterium]|nr:2-succinyl-6-hydroxy-2,4-cyclohexadiene-1-carboxylate synthase [Ignavibacteriales bacterium]
QALLLSLRLFGQGVMLPVTGLLPDLKIATLLMAGELDAKYLQINEQMSRLIPHNNYHRIAGCGHNIHLEKTGEFVNLVLSFLNQLKETK